MSRRTKISTGIEPEYSRRKSYSIDEIMATGGATAFTSKMGKNAKNIFEALKTIQKEGFLTEEDADAALKTLNGSK